MNDRMGCMGALFGTVVVVAIIFLIYTFYHYEDLMEGLAWTFRTVAIVAALLIIAAAFIGLVILSRVENPLMRWTNPERHNQQQLRNNLGRIFGDTPYEQLRESEKELYRLIESYHDEKDKERWKPKH